MRIGTDIVEIERIKQAVERNPRFVQKILTASELTRFNSLGEARALEFLAGRFCAKEAYLKALGTGIGRIRLVDVEISAGPNGAPYIAQAPIRDNVQVSISHCRQFATAMVLIELTDDDINAKLNQLFYEKEEKRDDTSK